MLRITTLFLVIALALGQMPLLLPQMGQGMIGPPIPVPVPVPVMLPPQVIPAILPVNPLIPANWPMTMPPPPENNWPAPPPPPQQETMCLTTMGCNYLSDCVVNPTGDGHVCGLSPYKKCYETSNLQGECQTDPAIMNCACLAVELKR